MVLEEALSSERTPPPKCHSTLGGLILRAVSAVQRILMRLRFLGTLFVFEPRQDDIYIVSYPRSGTTLAQMLLYQLVSNGSVAFDHISQVSPFVDSALRRGRNLNRLPSPRLLKTHWSYERFPNWPGKYIYVVRDGKDVLVSYFHFQRTHFNADLGFEQFFQMFLDGRCPYGSWFRHVRGWTAHGARAEHADSTLWGSGESNRIDRQTPSVILWACGFRRHVAADLGAL